jgi:hypothetical protein
VALLAFVPVSGAASPKLTARDFNRIGGANGAAFGAIGLVLQRGCNPDALPCIRKATTREAAVDDRVAAISRSLLPKLSPGPCRQAIAAMYSAWHRRAGLVRHGTRLEGLLRFPARSLSAFAI